MSAGSILGIVGTVVVAALCISFLCWMVWHVKGGNSRSSPRTRSGVYVAEQVHPGGTRCTDLERCIHSGWAGCTGWLCQRSVAAWCQHRLAGDTSVPGVQLPLGRFDDGDHLLYGQNLNEAGPTSTLTCFLPVIQSTCLRCLSSLNFWCKPHDVSLQVSQYCRVRESWLWFAGSPHPYTQQGMQCSDAQHQFQWLHNDYVVGRTSGERERGGERERERERGREGDQMERERGRQEREREREREGETDRQRERETEIRILTMTLTCTCQGTATRCQQSDCMMCAVLALHAIFILCQSFCIANGLLLCPCASSVWCPSCYHGSACLCLVVSGLPFFLPSAWALPRYRFHYADVKCFWTSTGRGCCLPYWNHLSSWLCQSQTPELFYGDCCALWYFLYQNALRSCLMIQGPVCQGPSWCATMPPGQMGVRPLQQLLHLLWTCHGTAAVRCRMRSVKDPPAKGNSVSLIIVK